MLLIKFSGWIIKVRHNDFSVYTICLVRIKWNRHWNNSRDKSLGTGNPIIIEINRFITTNIDSMVPYNYSTCEHSMCRVLDNNDLG